MEDLATAALQAGSEHLVFDQYTNFICLESEMFCLKPQGQLNLLLQLKQRVCQ